MGANPSKPYDIPYCTTTLQSALVLGSQKLRSGGASRSMDFSKVYPWERKTLQTYDIPYCTTTLQSTLVLGGQNQESHGFDDFSRSARVPRSAKYFGNSQKNRDPIPESSYPEILALKYCRHGILCISENLVWA